MRCSVVFGVTLRFLVINIFVIFSRSHHRRLLYHRCINLRDGGRGPPANVLTVDNVTISLRSTMLSSPPGFVAIFRPKTVSVIQTQRTTIYFTVFIIDNNSSTIHIKHLNLDCISLTVTVTLDHHLSLLSLSFLNVTLYTIRGGGAGGGATRRM